MERRIVAGLDELPVIIEFLKSLLNVCSVFTFTGSLGAGKTTLIRSLLKNCGVKEAITSPTFTYLNLYKNEQGQEFYHFDCYRLKQLSDFLAAGFDEYLYADGCWTFIEWPEIVMPLLKRKVCHVSIEHYGPNQREFIVHIVE